MRRVNLALSSVILLLSTTALFAEVPRLINYQGRLVSKQGAALKGKHTVRLRLYDAPTGGNLLWEESHRVDLSPEDNGSFDVILGNVLPFHRDLSFNAPLWLSQEVDDGAEAFPREALAGAGFALNSGRLDGMSAAQIIASARINPSRELLLSDLPLHGKLHQPGGTDALPTGTPVDVAAANISGTAKSFARSDHAHQGLHSIAVSGKPPLVGEVVLMAGENIALSQQGQAIVIDASGSSTSGAHGSVSAAEALSLPGKKPVELLSQTIKIKDPEASVLVLATVQLSYSAVPTSKTVAVSVMRDGKVLETYSVEIGTAPRAVSEIPVTLHAWDKPGAGMHAYSVSATSSDSGVEAKNRRLTVTELP